MKRKLKAFKLFGVQFNTLIADAAAQQLNADGNGDYTVKWRLTNEVEGSNKPTQPNSPMGVVSIPFAEYPKPATPQALLPIVLAKINTDNVFTMEIEN